MMLRFTPAFTLVLSLVAATDPAAPPVAPRIDHREVHQGATVVDNYFWLREKTNPEVTKYLQAENAYTAAMTADLAPFQDTLYKEMLGRIKQTDLSVPYREGEYFYYSTTQEGKQYPVFCRKKGSLTGAEEVLLDQNAMGAGLMFISVGNVHVSDDGNLLAYTTDTTGFRQYTLHVKDLRTGTVLPDTAERVTSLEWASDNKTIFFATEDAVTKRSNLIFRHTLGKPANVEIFHEKDELYRSGVDRTRDKKLILIGSYATDSTEFRFIESKSPDGTFKVVIPREKGHKYFVDHRDGLFYIRTNRDAKNYRVVTAPLGEPLKWKEFLAAQGDVLVQGVDLFKDYAVALEKTEAVNRIRVMKFGSNQWKSIAFPEPVYATFAAANPEYNTKLFRYTYQSMITPGSVFDYDMETGQGTLLKRQEVLGGYDPAQYESKRLWATARDGVRVPLSIVYKKGIKQDGSAPLFLYAYGSYGIGTPATFNSSRLSLLDRGMVYAIAHIRGGDEMGEAWHDDGMLMKKKNTFTDFIDSAEFLIKDHWTAKDRLVIEGGSAGGLLMGAVTNMRPDLFRAVHAAVPFMDVMNTMLDASLPLTVGEYLEWGNPNEKGAYDYMRSYSPYDNLEKRDYPAMLVTSSFNDSQVMYWEPSKYVASLRTLKTDKNPLIFKINMEPAGHGGASGRYDRLKQQAFEYAWMMKQVGITQ